MPNLFVRRFGGVFTPYAFGSQPAILVWDQDTGKARPYFELCTLGFVLGTLYFELCTLSFVLWACGQCAYGIVRESLIDGKCEQSKKHKAQSTKYKVQSTKHKAQ